MCVVIALLQELYPQLIHNARGVDIYFAISSHTADIRGNLISEIMAQQVIVGYCAVELCYIYSYKPIVFIQ